MSSFVHVKGGFVHKTHGSGIKKHVEKRHEETPNPNLEILKESLHQLTMKGGKPKQKASGGSIIEKPKKQQKYIVF